MMDEVKTSAQIVREFREDFRSAQGRMRALTL